jgi:hypothetical protein
LHDFFYISPVFKPEASLWMMHDPGETMVKAADDKKVLKNTRPRG